MKEFEAFVKNFLSALFILFVISFITSGFLTDWAFGFLFSFTLGYTLMVCDYILLIRFFRKFIQQATIKSTVKSGFLWRYLFIMLSMVSISFFTPLNFFAIILAILVTNVGLILAAVKHYQGWRIWKKS